MSFQNLKIEYFHFFFLLFLVANREHSCRVSSFLHCSAYSFLRAQCLFSHVFEYDVLSPALRLASEGVTMRTRQHGPVLQPDRSLMPAPFCTQLCSLGQGVLVLMLASPFLPLGSPLVQITLL